MKHGSQRFYQRLAMLMVTAMLLLPMLAPLGQAEAARWPNGWTGSNPPAGDGPSVQRVSWSSSPQ